MKPDFTMQDARFGALVAFAAVAEESSFTRAARRLHVSPSAVSQAVRRLEARVGTALLARTSRRVGITEAGERLLGRAGPALRELAGSLTAATGGGRAVQGTLRVTVPRIAAQFIAPAVLSYLEENPQASAEVSVDDGFVDLVREGVDVGVRLDESIDADMIALRASPPFRFVIVGAPAYLDAHGEPRAPKDLASHVCIGQRMKSTQSIYRWELERDGRAVTVAARGPLVSDDIAFEVAAARAGLGLAYVDEPSVAADLARGTLRVVLEAWAPKVPGFFAYYPATSRNEPRVRAFAAALRRVRRKTPGAAPRA